MTTDDDLTFKLAQKIRVADTDPERVMLTNLYLSAGEHDTLAVLPADVVTKTRWAVSWAGTTLAVDQFHGHLSGLVLAEAELGPDVQLLRLPHFAVRDVTHDDCYDTPRPISRAHGGRHLDLTNCGGGVLPRSLSLAGRAFDLRAPQRSLPCDLLFQYRRRVSTRVSPGPEFRHPARWSH